MIFNLLSATIAIFATSAVATPAPSAEWNINTNRELSSRTPGGIFLCDGANFNGTCGFAVQPFATCIVLGTDWNNKISSLGPDQGAVVVAFDANDCTGNATAFVFPGNSNLTTIGWDKVISSFEVLKLI